jgi:hypothetical protein
MRRQHPGAIARAPYKGWIWTHPFRRPSAKSAKMLKALRLLSCHPILGAAIVECGAETPIRKTNSRPAGRVWHSSIISQNELPPTSIDVALEHHSQNELPPRPDACGAQAPFRKTNLDGIRRDNDLGEDFRDRPRGLIGRLGHHSPSARNDVRVLIQLAAPARPVNAGNASRR